MMTHEIPNIFQGNKDETLSQFWNAKPFPHLCIDDFLESEYFKVLAEAAADASIKPASTFETEIEKGKAIFSNENSPEPIQDIVHILSHPEFVEQLRILTGIDSVKPLTEFNSEFIPFNYFHRMTDGGYLGSHVDHSSIGKNDVHILNCIFYISEEWDSSWGGHTVFFNKLGFKEKARIMYKPNRLVIFLHSSQSFHGVTKLKGNSLERSTIYMDYNTDKDNLKYLNVQSHKSGSKFVAKYWRHQTTFIPFTLRHFRYFYIYSKYIDKRVLRPF
jgi:hypothetical protein